MSKIGIFLADDHSLVREGIKMLINSQPDMEVIGEAADGLTATARVRELQPDVVVMDISMPDMTGEQATSQLHDSFPALKVVALSVHESRSYLRDLLKAGASGYVLKRAAPEELINAIRVVAAGGMYVAPVFASELPVRFTSYSSPGRAQLPKSLSQRESEVMRLIARGFSNKEIASQLGVSIKTVETYKARAMQKIGLNSRTDIVRYALDQGWLQDY